jgi:hypothetical protein
MYGPIPMGKKGSKVQWVNFNIVSKQLLGFVPEKNAQLTKDQLSTLGFLHACGEKKLNGTAYGKVYYLI